MRPGMKFCFAMKKNSVYISFHCERNKINEVDRVPSTLRYSL